jgi:hypothetical protein
VVAICIVPSLMTPTYGLCLQTVPSPYGRSRHSPPQAYVRCSSRRESPGPRSRRHSDPRVKAPAGTVLSAAAFEFRFNADSRRDTEHGGMASSGRTHLKRSLRNGPPVSLEPTPTGASNAAPATAMRLLRRKGSCLELCPESESP